MSTRHRHSSTTTSTVKDSNHHYLPTQLKKLTISTLRHRTDDSGSHQQHQQRQPHSRHHHSQDKHHRSSGKAQQALSPVYEQPAHENPFGRHHDTPQQRNCTSFRTITEVHHGSAIPNRHSQVHHISELEERTPSISSISPDLRPPSVDESASLISSISSAMNAQTRSLPPPREMTFDEARVQLRGLQSRLQNLESPYSISKFGPPQRNELKKVEKAAASLARDCDYLIGRAYMPVRNGLTAADTLKSEVEAFWEGLLERLVRQKQYGEY